MNWYKRLFNVGVDLEHLKKFTLSFEDDQDLTTALEAIKRALDRQPHNKLQREVDHGNRLDRRWSTTSQEAP